MYVIIANYGDVSIAVIEWAKQNKLPNVHVVSVDTGWQATSWQQRVLQAEALVKNYGFTAVRLKAKMSFAELVRERQAFPNKQFQWCAGFLKGLTILDWLEQIDLHCEATIISGKRQSSSRAYFNLPEYIEANERFGERRVWHPLYLHTEEQQYSLIKQTGFPILGHRSLECEPCIHNTEADFLRMDMTAIDKVDKLEQTVGKAMFASERYGNSEGIKAVINYVKAQTNVAHKIQHPDFLDDFNMGCGDPFACGE